jgi:D-3-phosphoglycerate dehydrogenase / 2-oxoglutarate reductase
MKVLISTSIFAASSSEPLDLLNTNNFEIILNPYNRKLSPEELIDLGNDVSVVVAGTEEYHDEILKYLPNLKLISRVGVGIDNLNLEDLKKRNIEFRTSNSLLADSVSELVIGLAIDICRNIDLSSNRIKNGFWDKQLGQLIKGKRVGIIGLGNIGSEVMKKFLSFGAEVLAYDIAENEELKNEHNFKYCSMEEIFSTAGIISIHLNKTKLTTGMIDRKMMNLMKKGNILINTSRGGIINEEDLYSFLKENSTNFAALDVFDKEPYEGNLCKLENVVLTPHIGSYTRQTREAMEKEAVMNVIKFNFDE